MLGSASSLATIEPMISAGEREEALGSTLCAMRRDSDFLHRVNPDKRLAPHERKRAGHARYLDAASRIAPVRSSPDSRRRAYERHDVRKDVRNEVPSFSMAAIQEDKSFCVATGP